MPMANDDLIRGGTATVAGNGIEVTGQGVSWSNVREGDFFGAHRGLAVPIAAIVGSVLTLAYPWPGAAQTAAAYAIQPKSDAVRLSAAVRDLITTLSDGDLAALGSLTSAADKLPFFTGPGTAGLASFTALARSLLAATAGPAARSAIGALGKNAAPASLNMSESVEGFTQFDGQGIGNAPTDSPNFQLAQVGTSGRGMRLAGEYGTDTGLHYSVGRDGWQPWQQLWMSLASQISRNVNGFCRLPNGIILQWGGVGSGNSDIAITFPTAFPNAAIYVGASTDVGASNNLFSTSVASIALTGCIFRKRVFNAGNVGGASEGFRWFAVGY
jgi:hypothetical protein